MTVSEQIIQVLDNLCTKMGIVIDWTSENVIPYVTMLCEKLITYEIATSSAWMAIMLIMVIGSLIAIKKWGPGIKAGIAADNYECITLSVIGIICCLFLYIIATCVLVEQTMDVIKCLTFPEMYVFEYVSRLIQS